MNHFTYSRASDVTDALRQIAADPAAKLIAGGTNLIDLMHAILGVSEHCIATHPSDMCVALAALEARVLASGTAGERSIAFADFHRLPGDSPEIDTNLRADELVTAVELPVKGFAKNYTY